jgi:hypothetical protein
LGAGLVEDLSASVWLSARSAPTLLSVESPVTDSSPLILERKKELSMEGNVDVTFSDHIDLECLIGGLYFMAQEWGKRYDRYKRKRLAKKAWNAYLAVDS